MVNTRFEDEELARAIARDVARQNGSTYFVGGYVRDHLLGLPNKDVDIEVHGISADALRSLLERFGQVTVVGESFGVFNIKGHTLDIALPRREGVENRSGKGRLAEVIDPYLGTRQAALRRDLTMNALYQDVLTSEVLDFFGGEEDLAAGIIRHVDEATFVEDPLRVLRVAQFAARFDMKVDVRMTELCASLDLRGLPSERVLGELRKALLKAKRPSEFFEALRDMRQLDPWFAEVGALLGVPQNPTFHPEGDVWTHTMLVLDAAATLRGQAEEPFAFMLSALCHDLGKATTTFEHDGRIVSYGHEKAGIPLAKTLLDRLGASGKTRSYVMNMVELHMLPNVHVTQHAGPKSFNHLFDRSVCPRDLLLLARADHLGCGGPWDVDDVARELADRLSAFEELMAQPYVQGRDLIELGVAPGPAMGEVLDYGHKLRLAGLGKDEQLRQCMGYWRRLRSKAEG